MILEDYLNLIPSANRSKPDFIASLSIGVSVQTRIQLLLGAMGGPLFDVDSAVGEQLDFIGKWVGITRQVAIPITGVYFSWDGIDVSVGWDYGVWQPADGANDVTSLPDDVYRTLIKFKIAANNWDGTTEGAYAIWEVLFPQYTFLIQDNQNMTYNLAILGGIVSSLTLALIRTGSIALKPEGVRIDSYFTAVDAGPVFAWDVENGNLGGWDTGSWAIESPSI